METQWIVPYASKIDGVLLDLDGVLSELLKGPWFDIASTIFAFVDVAFCLLKFVGTPFSAISKWIFKTDEKKQAAIDKAYEDCKTSVRRIVCNQLEDKIGFVLTKLIDKVTVDALPRRIEAFEEMINQLSKSRQDIIAKKELQSTLASKIELIREKVQQLQDDFQQ